MCEIGRMGRDSIWTDEEVKTFIGIWGDTRIQKELDGAVRNKSVFKVIAVRMKEAELRRIGLSIEIS